jgi:hypothetical protein
MASPKSIKDKMDRMINGWKTLAPTKTFGGLTEKQFEDAVKPSYDVRAEIAAIEETRNAKLAERDEIDAESMAKAALVVAGVVADPTEGPDSPLYESFGYVRKSEKKSGLTRRKKTPSKG